MCGIAGVFQRAGDVDIEALERLSSALAHRGPDDQGHVVTGKVGLVHTRLSIVDLAHGHQPFTSPAGNTLIANGEIYNDRDLRVQLAPDPCRTASDCEPLLYLYEALGETFANAVRGMYAIAIHDAANDRLVLSRDRFGIKPLYFVEGANGFAFASEPQALIKAGFAGVDVDATRRAELMQMQFTTGPGTIFPTIERVAPGETLVVEGGQVVRRLHLPAMATRAAPVAEPQAMALIDRVLKETTLAHMRADVPYGLFLSGGIDSAALLAAMTAVSDQPIVALTAAFRDQPEKDESEKAQRVAESVGAVHHIVEVGGAEFLAHLPAVAGCLDDPTCDASALPLFMLGKEAARLGLKVVLSGEGADEMFGGYKRYRRATWMFGLWREQTRKRGIIERAQDTRSTLAHWRDGIAALERARPPVNQSALQRLQTLDCGAWLPNDLLLKLDRCLMIHGVEGRTPYLDERLSPFSFALPDSLKVRGKQGKYLLRAWLSENMPAADAWSRKQGFVLPIAHWLQRYRDRLEPLMRAHPALKGLDMAGHIDGIFEDRRRGQAGWNLLFYALWHSHHVLGVDASGSVEEVLAAAQAFG